MDTLNMPRYISVFKKEKRFFIKIDKLTICN